MEPSTNNKSFKEYLLQNRHNRAILMLSFVAMIIQFVIFKYYYPYASYIHADSFVYINTAYANLGINSYMIGYPMFLRVLSVFTNADTIVVACQYILIEGSALFLLFTLFYFLSLKKVVQIILVCFIVINPLFLHMSNLISSDAFFLSTSSIWLTLLFWIMYRPNLKLIFWHTIIIFICFTTRYNALIYLFISCIGFKLSEQSIIRKLMGIAAGFVVIGIFVIHTGNQYKTLTGVWQYSPFAGWQLANNAMYAYRFVDSVNRKPVPQKYKDLDNMVRVYFDSTRDIRKHPIEGLLASTVYMWDPSLTLYKYRDGLFKRDSNASEFKKWASMGPLYKDYGIYLIKQYPLHFARYFMWPNANKYYAPPIEFLESYNSGKDSVLPIAKYWFDYRSSKIYTRMKELNVTILDYYPILTGILNVIMLFGLISFMLLGGLKNKNNFRNGVVLALSFWLINAAFTIFASSAALRFQAFPIVFTMIFSTLLVEWVTKLAVYQEPKKSKSNPIETISNQNIFIN